MSASFEYPSVVYFIFTLVVTTSIVVLDWSRVHGQSVQNKNNGDGRSARQGGLNAWWSEMERSDDGNDVRRPDISYVYNGSGQESNENDRRTITHNGLFVGDNNGRSNGRNNVPNDRWQQIRKQSNVNMGMDVERTRNCSRCVDDNAAASLRRDLNAQEKKRISLESALNTYAAELYDLRNQLHSMKSKTTLGGVASLPLTAAGSVSFSAKLSYNRELKPLDTVVFDTVLSNQGQGYDPETGLFTAPLPGTYMFHCTILSGYNTKVETAVIANDQEITRIYSGAHDAHGSGSNMAILDLHSDDVVWVRLLYQGGNHVHGYYSTFSGVLLAEKEEDD